MTTEDLKVGTALATKVKDVQTKFKTMTPKQIESYANEQLKIARETDDTTLCIIISQAVCTYHKLPKFIVIKEPMMI